MKAHPRERWSRDTSRRVGGKDPGDRAWGHGSWPGESWGENTCRNGTDVVLHEKSKNRYNHGNGCPRFIYESVVEVESNFRTRIKQKSIQKLVAVS